MAGTSQSPELENLDFEERDEFEEPMPDASWLDLEPQSAPEADLSDVSEKTLLKEPDKKAHQFYYARGETPDIQAASARQIIRDPKLFTANQITQKKSAPPSANKNKGKVDTSLVKVKDVVDKSTGTAMKYQQIYDLVETMQYLYVKVVRARNLAGKDAGVDPYVKLSVGELSLNTQVIQKDLSPEWNRVFAVSEDKLSGQFIEISVWNADMVGAKDFLGALSFELGGIPSRKPPENSPAPLWYKLEERSGKTRVQGELMIALWMGNQADEAFQEAWQSDIGGHSERFRSVYLSPKLWYLRVHIIEAQDLLPLDKYRQAEPFVEVSLGLVKNRRVYVPTAKGTNPVWNHDVMFVVAEPFEEFLQVTLEIRTK